MQVKADFDPARPSWKGAARALATLMPGTGDRCCSLVKGSWIMLAGIAKEAAGARQASRDGAIRPSA
jgi:hypothetical protein